MHSPSRGRPLRALCLILGILSQRCAAAPADDLAVTGEIRGQDGAFDFAAVDPALGALYVAREDGVMRVDLATRQVTSTFVPGNKVHAVIPLPDGRLLSTNGETNTITLADARTGAVLATLPAGRNPDAAIRDPATGLVFVMNGDDGTVTVVDPAGPAVSQITIGGTLKSAAADGAGRLYVAVKDSRRIAVLDIAQRKPVAAYPLPDCEDPSGLALDPANRILLAACKNQKAVAVRADDGAVVASLEIDRVPHAVLFDSDRKLFFVPCARDATMIAIAANDGRPTVLRKIPTAIGARTGALDPRSGALYLPAADYSIGFGGITQKAGTFRILVVGAPHG